MSHKIYALYNDETDLLKAVERFRLKGIAIQEAYTPFHVHGLREAMVIPRTRMAIVSFLCGATGLILGLIGTWYMMIYDWPLNVGGKPSFTFIENLPAFVPPLFEAMVFSAAHGMALIFLLRSWILPGVRSKNPDPRTTDDAFCLEFETDEQFSENDILNAVRESGAAEISKR